MMERIFYFGEIDIKLVKCVILEGNMCYGEKIKFGEKQLGDQVQFEISDKGRFRQEVGRSELCEYLGKEYLRKSEG